MLKAQLISIVDSNAAHPLVLPLDHEDIRNALSNKLAINSASPPYGVIVMNLSAIRAYGGGNVSVPYNSIIIQ